MSKRLKLVSVRLKSDRGVYKNATFATATDVAFLMAKEIAEFDNETIGVLNLNAKGNLLSMNVVTLNAFEKNMADICAASILSNAGSTILISKEEAMIRNRKIELTKRFQSNMEMLGIPVLDHIEGSEKKDHSSFISYIKRSYMEHCLEKPKSIFLSETAVNLKNIDPDINHLKLRTDRYFNDFQRNDESGLTKDSALKIIQKDTANRLKYCGQILGIEVKDSLIIGKDVSYSFAAAGEKGWDDAETYKIDPESRMLIKEEQPEFCNSGWSKEHNVTKELSKAIQKAYGIDL
ncbi:MAG: JAB domain-containing protein [Clostridia bacterium]